MNGHRSKYVSSVDDIQFCHDAFAKCRVISSSPENWKLPDQSLLFTARDKYKVDVLQQLQESLHSTKSQLNTFPLEEWRQHTRKRNLVASLMYQIRSTDSAELFIQSWPKLWEILHKYELIPNDIQSLKSVHLCEAPGAFVSALNHFLKQNRPTVVNFDWLATSINPYYEDFDPDQVINDDRIIRHTLDKWVFGPDSTGNIFESSLVNNLIKRSGGSEVNLVTADGSQENRQSTELLVINLFYAETITALKLLSKGGHFVLKIFTTFECPTIDLVYLLCCCFAEVHMFKPVSSREATSESYLICKGYRFDRNDEEFQSYLHSIEAHRNDKAKEDSSMFPLDSIPQEFLNQLQAVMKYFVDMQKRVITANIASFPFTKYPHEWNRRKFIREEIANRFQKIYEIKELPKHQRLCPYVEGQLEKFVIDNTYLGSWEDQNVVKTNMTNAELKLQLQREFQIVKYSFEWPFEDYFQTIKWKTTEEDFREHLKITQGAPVKNILNSRFITKKLLNFFHDVVALEFSNLESTSVTNQIESNHIEITLPLSPVQKSLRDHENEFMEQLSIHLKNVKGAEAEEVSLEFKNVLLVGQRSIGVIYLLSKLLKDTGTEMKLSVGGELMFTHLTSVTAGIMDAELDKWLPRIKDDTVIGFVDIRELRNNKPDKFFDLITIFNNFSCTMLCDKFFNK